MPILHRITGKTEARSREWFLRHLHLVTRIEVSAEGDGARMLAYLEGGLVLEDHYTSQEGLWDSLHRYTLFGTPLYWMGTETEIRPRQRGKAPGTNTLDS